MGVVEKYACLHPVGEDKEAEDGGQTYEAWARDRNGSENVDGSGDITINEEVSVEPVSMLPSTVQLSEETTRDYLPPSVPQAEARVVLSKMIADNDDDPATMDREKKVSSTSTIEMVVPLHNSLQLVSVGVSYFSFHPFYMTLQNCAFLFMTGG